MKRSHLFPGLLLLLAAAPARAQEKGPVTGLPLEDPTVEAIWALEDADSRVMEILDELANGIGPRLTSSRNLTEACEWAAQRFEDWGLKNVHLEEWGTFPVGFDRGLQRGRLVFPRKKPLRFGTNAWTAGTKGPLRGPVVRCPDSEEAMGAARGKLGGAWVLVGGVRPRFDGKKEDLRSRLGRFLDVEGIAGLLVPTRSERIITSGNYRIAWEHLPTRITVNLHPEDAKMLEDDLARGTTPEVEFDIENRFVKGPIPLYDVIAEIPGTDKPGEMVVFGGHLDSWDGAQGAQDNGTGTATAMEAARLLAKLGVKPRRTIRFMLWSGEEQGLLGSQGYIRLHPEENARISAVIVHDAGTNALSGISATHAMFPIFQEAFAPLIAITAGSEDSDLVFKIAEVEGLPFGVGSDHDSYLQQGVPGFFWHQKGRTSYQHVHHTQFDTFDTAVPEYERHSSKVVAAGAWRLANLPMLLPREKLVGPPPRRMGILPEEGQGLVIRQVMPGSLAAKAGLKPKDKVVRIDDRKLESLGDLRRALRAGKPRKQVVIQRGGRELVFWFDWEKQSVTGVIKVPETSRGN